MKNIGIVLLALAPALAQIRPVGTTQPAPAPDAAKMPSSAPSIGTGTRAPRISMDSLKVLQTGFDSDLASFDYNDSIDVIGRTRGVYLSDYGVVFTTELSPIVTPGITPFVQKIPDEMKERVHQRKLERMPVIRRLMTQMMKRAADQLKLLPNDQQIVLVVRLLYLPYENTERLPTQIVMKGDKISVLADRYTTVEE